VTGDGGGVLFGCVSHPLLAFRLSFSTLRNKTKNIDDECVPFSLFFGKMKQFSDVHDYLTLTLTVNHK